MAQLPLPCLFDTSTKKPSATSRRPTLPLIHKATTTYKAPAVHRTHHPNPVGHKAPAEASKPKSNTTNNNKKMTKQKTNQPYFAKLNNINKKPNTTRSSPLLLPRATPILLPEKPLETTGRNRRGWDVEGMTGLGGEEGDGVGDDRAESTGVGGGGDDRVGRGRGRWG